MVKGTVLVLSLSAAKSVMSLGTVRPGAEVSCTLIVNCTSVARMQLQVTPVSPNLTVAGDVTSKLPILQLTGRETKGWSEEVHVGVVYVTFAAALTSLKVASCTCQRERL